MEFESVDPVKNKIDVHAISPGHPVQTTYDEFCKAMLRDIAKAFGIPKRIIVGRRERN